MTQGSEQGTLDAFDGGAAIPAGPQTRLPPSRPPSPPTPTSSTG